MSQSGNDVAKTTTIACALASLLEGVKAGLIIMIIIIIQIILILKLITTTTILMILSY